MTRVSARSAVLSPAGSALQTAANRMAAAIRPPERGPGQFGTPTQRAAAVSNAFGAVRRRRRRSRKLARTIRRKVKTVRKRTAKRRAHGRFVKGSAAAKRHMARLRNLRKKRR